MHFLRRLLAALALAAPLALGVTASGPAHADSISLGGTYSGTFSMLIDGVRASEGGGSIGGSSGVIGGSNVIFTGLYCVDQFTGASLNTTYTATYNTSGIINGIALPAAGKIAWLMTNIAPALTLQSQFQALQGLIWQLQSPASGHVVAFDTNTAYNSAATVGYYNTYLAALGNNVAPVSSVYWVNPQNAQGQYAYQGFVAITPGPLSQTATPEPASLGLLAVGLAGMAAARRRKRMTG